MTDANGLTAATAMVSFAVSLPPVASRVSCPPVAQPFVEYSCAFASVGRTGDNTTLVYAYYPSTTANPTTSAYTTLGNSNYVNDLTEW